MKVLLFDGVTGGHHIEYAGHISRYLQREGDEVTFATSRRPTDLTPLMDEGFDQVWYLAEARNGSPTDPFRLLITRFVDAYRSLTLATRGGADVVHFLYLDRSEIVVLAALIGRTRRPAVFGTLFWPYFVHGNHETVQTSKRLFHAVSGRALGRLLAGGKMDALFLHSERIKSLVLAGPWMPSLSDKIVVVPDPAKEPPPISAEEARADLGLPADTPVILMFGGTRPDKGPDILLRALPHLGGEWVAVIAGEPVTVGEREADACRQALQSPDRLVTRFGYIPEREADKYFRAADVIVLPYRREYKGTSGVQRRAAASGKPVIVTDVGDVGPSVRDEGLGTVVPPESPELLAAALKDFLLRREEIQRDVEPRALSYAEANSWEVLGAVTRERYLTVLEGRRASGRRGSGT